MYEYQEILLTKIFLKLNGDLKIIDIIKKYLFPIYSFYNVIKCREYDVTFRAQNMKFERYCGLDCYEGWYGKCPYCKKNHTEPYFVFSYPETLVSYDLKIHEAIYDKTVYKCRKITILFPVSRQITQKYHIDPIQPLLITFNDGPYTFNKLIVEARNTFKNIIKSFVKQTTFDIIIFGFAFLNRETDIFKASYYLIDSDTLTDFI
jgi:hypothetical protein